jgi:hypothetical protein
VEVIVLLVFISMVLVAGALVMLFSRIRDGDIEHGDRLSLLPLEGDDSSEEPGGEKGDGE